MHAGARLAGFAGYPLLFGPSPIHRLDRLTAHLGGAAVWVKRDDCNSGLAYGGNKTRKLEYLVADALAQGCDTLVSIGGVQSNHTRQVAAAAAKTGLGCVLVQESWVDWPDVVYDRVGNIQLSRTMGADVRLVQAGFGIGFKESWERALADVEAAGGKPYAIPAGASDHPLGGLGFASWAFEVEQQERELGVFVDTIVVCSVTGSTQAGMVAGFAGQERGRRVIGIDGSAKPGETRDQVAWIGRRTAELIGVGRDLRENETILDDRYHAGTYGIPDEGTLEAIRLAGRLEGMITDPVYEGKSMAGLVDLVARGEIDRDATVLYAHLGGQPALSATAPSSAIERQAGWTSAPGAARAPARAGSRARHSVGIRFEAKAVARTTIGVLSQGTTRPRPRRRRTRAWFRRRSKRVRTRAGTLRARPLRGSPVSVLGAGHDRVTRCRPARSFV